MAVHQLVDPRRRVLSTEDILKLTDRRLNENAGRNRRYDESLAYYQGQQSSGSGGVGILGMSAEGRIRLRDLGESINAHRAYTSNRLAPIVDDYMALGGIMPQSRVEPPDMSPEGEAKAEKLTRYLVSTHELSKMDLQQPEAAFYLSDMGDACYTLDIDIERERVVWNILNPRSAHPGFHRGHRRFEIFDLVVAEVWEPSEINASFGNAAYVKPDASPQDCTVIFYFSPFQRTALVGTENAQVARHTEWDLGFCPAGWAFNKVPGIFGLGDIEAAKRHQDFLDWAQNVAADALVYGTYGLTIIKDPQNVQQDEMVTGPGATIATTGTGDVKLLTPNVDLHTWQLLQQSALADLNAASGSSEVRQEGKMAGSIITGRAVHAVQGPQATRIDLKKQVLGAVIQEMNSKTLAMQEKAPGIRDKEIEIYGRYRGKSFRDTLTAKDIDGWHRNRVSWEQMVGLNLQQKGAVANELRATGLIDDFLAMEMMGQDDPTGMRQRVRADKLFAAATEAEVQRTLAGAVQPGGGQGTPGGSQPPAASGGQPSGPPPPQPGFRPPGLGGQQGPPPGLPTGVPIGISRKAVEKALAEVAAKLHGSVWAVGELAMNAQSATPQLLVSDSRDQPTVMRALKPLAQGVRVRQMDEAKMPTEAVRLV